MKINIAFVNLPSIPFDDVLASFSGENLQSQPISMPMGILYLSSYIKKYNQSQLENVGIIDYVPNIKDISNYKNVEDFIMDIAKKYIDFVPDILAFSLIFSTSYPFFNIAVNILKSMWPNTVIMVGGAHATNCTLALLENKNVDYVVRGEGELAVSEFVKQYSNLECINVKGIYSKKDINILPARQFELCDFVKDLDVLPFPDHDLIDMNIYISATGRKRNIGNSSECKIGTIITTRGCPFRCTFCSGHTVHGRIVRFRSVENVTEEVKFLYNRFGIKLFIIEDDLFTANKTRVIHLLQTFKSLEIPDFELQFPSALSINTLDEQVMDTLIGAGMKIASLAIESGSEYIQRYVIKKNCNLKKAKEVVRFLKNKGLIVRCYFILGFPSETKEQMIETVEYAKELGADWCLFNIATPLVGTEMYDQFIKMGCIQNDIDIWSKAFFQSRKFDTVAISARELNEFAYRANLDCNFVNNPNKVNRQFEKAIEIYQDIILRYPFHIIAWYFVMECYNELGNFDAASKAIEQIKILIKSDKRSTEMFAKYNDLMPALKKNAVNML